MAIASACAFGVPAAAFAAAPNAAENGAGATRVETPAASTAGVASTAGGPTAQAGNAAASGKAGASATAGAAAPKGAQGGQAPAGATPAGTDDSAAGGAQGAGAAGTAGSADADPTQATGSTPVAGKPAADSAGAASGASKDAGASNSGAAAGKSVPAAPVGGDSSSDFASSTPAASDAAPAAAAARAAKPAAAAATTAATTATTAKPAAATAKEAKASAATKLRAAVKTQEDPDNAAGDETAPSIKLGVSARIQGKKKLADEVYAKGNGKAVRVGTMGKSLRLEQLKFRITGDVTDGVQVQAYVQGVGWQAVGENAGLVSAGKRIEAIRVMLVGTASQWFNVRYRAYMQDSAWGPWKRNGAIAGAAGDGKRMEALELKLLKKKAQTEASSGIVGIRTRTHVQNLGWQRWVKDGEDAGTVGRALRVEMVKLALDPGAYDGNLVLKAHVEGTGWTDKLKGLAVEAGTTGKGLRIEALTLKLAGEISKYYDVVYRAHVQNVGWQPWVLNGAKTGSTGKAQRIEALEIKLVQKGKTYKPGRGTYYVSLAGNLGRTLASASTANGAQARSAAFANNFAERYYLRKAGKGAYQLQSVNSGLFLSSEGGKLVQRAYSATQKKQRFSLSAWDGGYTLIAKGGNVALAGSNAVVAKAGAKWVLTRTSIIPDGYYNVFNRAQNRLLNVNSKEFTKAGANVTVYDAKNMGTQIFRFANQGDDDYTIVCALSDYSIEVQDGSKGNGANVRQWGANGSAAQRWTVLLDVNGGLVFKNKASGKVMTALGTGAASSNVASYSYKRATTQRWTLRPVAWNGNPALSRATDIARNLSSNTGYLITVDLSNHWLCIFKGGRGNWTMDRNWIISNGKKTSPTVTGDFTTQAKGYSFGHGYTCYYYTQFYGDYLFHSIKYKEGTRIVSDGRLGQYVSMGCVRMEIDNAKWIYDHIPTGTHVKVYN